MPKNPAIEIMERWRAMDAALGDGNGLRVTDFAQRWNVSTKTVHRDLKTFGKLKGRRIFRNPEDGTHHYDSWNVEWLFTYNLGRHPRRDRNTKDRLRW
jgi:hypothetical protein